MSYTTANHQGMNVKTDATVDSSATHDKVVGQMHVNNGKVEEKLGHALGRPEMELRGEAKQVQGETEKAIGERKKEVESSEKEMERADKERREAEKDRQRIHEENERERRKYEEEREEAFRKAARTMNVEERRVWDDSYYSEYRRVHGEPRWMAAPMRPLAVAEPRTVATTTTATGPTVAYPLAPGQHHHNPHHAATVVHVHETANLGPEYRVNPATGVAVRTETEVVHDVMSDKLRPQKGARVDSYVKHPVVGTTVVDGVYVDNTHPATVVSTGAHDVQVGKMHERNGKMQEKIGHALHNPELEARGHAKQVIGQNEQEIGETKKVAEKQAKEIKKAQNV